METTSACREASIPWAVVPARGTLMAYAEKNSQTSWSRRFALGNVSGSQEDRFRVVECLSRHVPSSVAEEEIFMGQLGPVSVALC